MKKLTPLERTIVAGIIIGAIAIAFALGSVFGLFYIGVR